MRTAEECCIKALELDGRAAETPSEQVRQGFYEMAAEWRRLAVMATREDAIANTGLGDAARR